MENESGNETGEHWHWLIRAKLDVPRQQVSLVQRPRLLDLLDSALERRLCLVVAPAGFGKTTLLAQWRTRLLQKQAKVAWLTLDEADNDVRQFLCYVVFALSAGGVGVDRLVVLAEQGLMELPAEKAVAAIMAAVAAEPGPVVLALDDYHRLQFGHSQLARIDSLVGHMLATMPDNFTLAINSRARPALLLPQLLAARHAIEIAADELRFSKEELRVIVDPQIAEDRLQLLFQRTEGWAMAIQLALLLVDSSRDERVLESFSGHSGHLAAYLADQVIAKLPAELQEFLIRTSILERFNAPLANAVTASNDGWESLRRLQPLHSLLVPLDEQHAWFRYHHLFADYLQDLLRCRHPELTDELHRRASAWFEENGSVIEAVRHARIASDFDRCSRLIEAAGGWELILYGGIGQLRNLMRNFADKELLRYPRLQLAKAYLAIKDGQILAARALCETAIEQAAGRTDRDCNTQGFGRDLLNVGILLDVYEDRKMTPADLQRLRRLEDEIPESDGITRGVLCCVESLTSLALGRFQDAQSTCTRAIRSMRRASSMLGLNYCYLHAGLAAFYQAEFREAEANFLEARRQAEDNFGADSGLKSLADVLLSVLLFWRDEWQEGDVDRLRKALDHVEQYDGWFEIYANGLDVEVAAALRGDGERDAELAIERAQRIVNARGIQRLAHLADALRLMISRMRGAHSGAARMAQSLGESFPRGIWREEGFLWRPYQNAAVALAGWHAGRDRAVALAQLDDLIDCCRTLRADFFLIRALIEKAQLLDHSARRPEALSALYEALRLAAPERIRMPFRERRLQSLLFAVQKRAREDVADMLTLNFIAACLGTGQDAAANGAAPGGGSPFSPREYEVVLELIQGQSNKEIARALDLTEHTVKFHLKNIFTKLDVSRRAEAIGAIQRLRLSSPS